MDTLILKSLESISTNYSVFEKDQVLTPEQLNSITDYFDDQTRLARVNLLGVGIVCGLGVTVQGNTVRVTKGVGITTDGDLLYLAGDTVFDKFKLYDASNPKYGPFYVAEAMIPIYELGRQGEADVRAAALDQFTPQTGKSLNNMVAVLFMESYVKDRDICTGTDCDNLGQDCINTLKLLLVENTSLKSLQNTIATPHQAFSQLNEVVVDRPLIPGSVSSFSQLAKIYRDKCGALHTKLVAELKKIYPSGTAFLTEVFGSDPSTEWETRLNALKTIFGGSDLGIQYYFDFLNDLAETFNHFHELLFGDRTWCCPDREAFPKHLLLGNLLSGSNPDDNRTAFYPSPILSQTDRQLDHARFLARKLDALIRSFQIPAAAGIPIRITPSNFSEQPLEERAIPYYYRVDSAPPIHKSWNYRLHVRGLDAYNYSYNAGAYNAQGGAADPFSAQIGRYSFFRIEGHLGQNVSAALTSLEKEIKDKNLPVAVRAVMLETDRTKVVKPPGIRYTDLHRLHYVLRQDVFNQLDDVAQFSGSFKQQVNDAVTANIVDNAPADSAGPTVKDLVTQKDSVIAGSTGKARTKINQSYSQYLANTTWQDDVQLTLKTAGEFKYDLSKVVKTEFTTPFDTIISNTHYQWLNWLDDLIKQKDDQEDDKLLFPNFLSQNPGLEHLAGVVRGGTFVLVYDKNNNVVADFMLPYYCCDTSEPEPAQPPLPKPGLKLPWLISNGIQVLPSRDKFINDKLNIFKTDQLEGFVQTKLSAFKTEQLDTLKTQLETGFNKKFDTQQLQYLNTMKESINVMGNALTGKVVTTTPGGVRGVTAFSDARLGTLVDDANQKQIVVNYLRQKASDPTLTPDQQKVYATQAATAEGDLAIAITNTTTYIAQSNMDVSAGTEGMTAMLNMNQILGTIKDPTVTTTVNTNLTRLSNTAPNQNTRIVLGTMIRR